MLIFCKFWLFFEFPFSVFFSFSSKRKCVICCLRYLCVIYPLNQTSLKEDDLFNLVPLQLLSRLPDNKLREESSYPKELSDDVFIIISNEQENNQRRESKITIKMMVELKLSGSFRCCILIVFFCSLS